MTIQEFAEIYYNLPDEERNINDWYPILEGFVKKIAIKYDNFEDFEERYQVAWIAATRAIKKYDLNSNTQFTTYAWLVISNDLNVFYKRCKREMKKRLENPSVSLDANVKGDGEGNKDKLILADMITDEKFEGFSNVFLNETVNELYEACSRNEKEVLLALLKGVTRPNISQTLGKNWTVSYVHAMVKNIRKKYERIINR